jgi:hypothetical protein
MTTFSSVEQTNAARYEIGKVVRFLPAAIIPVLFECLHYSIDTIATVGYGDITAGNWIARTVSDVEVASGLILIVFALGVAFSGRSDDPSEPSGLSKSAASNGPS